MFFKWNANKQICEAVSFTEGMKTVLSIIAAIVVFLGGLCAYGSYQNRYKKMSEEGNGEENEEENSINDGGTGGVDYPTEDGQNDAMNSGTDYPTEDGKAYQRPKKEGETGNFRKGDENIIGVDGY